MTIITIRSGADSAGVGVGDAVAAAGIIHGTGAVTIPGITAGTVLGDPADGDLIILGDLLRLSLCPASMMSGVTLPTMPTSADSRIPAMAAVEEVPVKGDVMPEWLTVPVPLTEVAEAHVRRSIMTMHQLVMEAPVRHHPSPVLRQVAEPAT